MTNETFLSPSALANVEGPPYPAELLDRLKGIARTLRREVVEMVFAASSGHPGGSLSSADIMTALYFAVMRHDPQRPKRQDRDRFIMSKGHASPIMYATLAEAGYFSKEHLPTFRKFGSILQGHNDSTAVPGVEMSAGSLGMGLSFGIGHALAGRLDGRDYRVYVLLGDGECQEGSVWEAAMAATFHKLDHLVAIVDKNGIQNDDFVKVTAALDPLDEKWRAFGWHVEEANGHSMASLLEAFYRVRQVQGQPSVIIAHTTKGKGVSFMEDNPAFHGAAPTPAQLERALQDIEKGLEEIGR